MRKILICLIAFLMLTGCKSHVDIREAYWEEDIGINKDAIVEDGVGYEGDVSERTAYVKDIAMISVVIHDGVNYENLNERCLDYFREHDAYTLDGTDFCLQQGFGFYRKMFSKYFVDLGYTDSKCLDYVIKFNTETWESEVYTLEGERVNEGPIAENISQLAYELMQDQHWRPISYKLELSTMYINFNYEKSAMTDTGIAILPGGGLYVTKDGEVIDPYVLDLTK